MVSRLRMNSRVRIAVISDTHGSVDLALQAVKSVGPVDAVVHLGDFRHDGLALAKRVSVPVHAVRGDNDPWDGEKELVLDFEGHRVFATHGHYYNVDASLDDLVQAARKIGAEAALFGHDHKPRVERQEGILLVNPGSLFFVENKKTFAMLEIISDELTARIIKI